VKTEISLPEAAAILGVPWYSARRLALRGLLGSTRRIGGVWLLDEQAVRTYAAERAEQAASEHATSSPRS
jgi:hypothetical protein